MTSTRRRVKVYTMNEERQWDDRGTGHVVYSFVESLGGLALEVRNEEDGCSNALETANSYVNKSVQETRFFNSDSYRSVLLQLKIQRDIVYQRQQETLIVWTENESCDLALSFQEKAGCDDIWEKICQVQGRDAQCEATQEEDGTDDRFEEVSDTDIVTTAPVELPPCELSKLDEIGEVFSGCLSSVVSRDKLAIALEQEDYIHKLIELFHVCEDLENDGGLHQLYEIFKVVFLLNRASLFEVMFHDDVIFDVVGVLEYDPSKGEPTRHRDYLASQACFKEVIPIKNSELLAKIHQTYRIQYVQDVILPTPSVFEENLLSSLSSLVFFNKVEIVAQLQEDDDFLDELFAQLKNESVTLEKQRDTMLFIKEMCSYSQTLKSPNRDGFFKKLTTRGLLPLLGDYLGQLDDPLVQQATIDILNMFADFNPSSVRDSMTADANNEEIILLNILIDRMIKDEDCGNGVQLMGLIRTFIDPDNMMVVVNRTEKSTFLSFFYKHCIRQLIAPLLAGTADHTPSRDDYGYSVLLGYVLELLTFCVEKHTYHIKNYIMRQDLLGRALVLLQSHHTHLVLAGLRFCRRIVGLQDEFYNRYLVRGDHFTPVVALFQRNSSRYNLINSAIIEIFEFIKQQNIKSLVAYSVERFMDVFSGVAYVQTFDGLKLRYDQEEEKKVSCERKSEESVPAPFQRTGRFRRDVRDLDEDEELWFNEDDDELDFANGDDIKHILGDTPQLPRLKDSHPLSPVKDRPLSPPLLGPGSPPLGSPPLSAGRKEFRLLSPKVNERPQSPPLIRPSLKSHTSGIKIKHITGLVDYPDEDSDEDESSLDLPSDSDLAASESPAKKPRHI